MRQAFSPPPPPPPASPFFDEGDIDEGLGQTEQNISAEDRVPPECPPFLPFLLSLDPYTFVTLGYIIAVLISMEAQRPEEQEAIGNFLEVIATNIEYISPTIALSLIRLRPLFVAETNPRVLFSLS